MRHNHYILPPKHFYPSSSKPRYPEEARYPRGEDAYHRPDDSKASISQHSYYDDDISELENSVLGHISNAAFTNHYFYDNRDLVQHKPRDSHRDHDVRAHKHRYYDDHHEMVDHIRVPPNYNNQPSHQDHYDSSRRPPSHHQSYQPTASDYRPKPQPIFDIRPQHIGKEYPYSYEDKPRSNGHHNYRGDKYYQDDNFEPKHHSNFKHSYKQSIDYKSYPQDIRSYGSRLPREEAYREDRDHYHYDDKSGYDYYPSRGYQDHEEPEYYDRTPDESSGSVLDNIRNSLPWPLSIVGRIGEHGSHARREKEYPDSIQSILNVIDAEDTNDGASYGSHQVLPFLDVENEV